MTEEGEEDEPLAEIAADVERRREADDEDEALFQSMETETVDSDEVWAQLAGDEEVPVAVGDVVDPESERDVRRIPSRTCHGCRYFAAPPEMACEHEGTEIREVVDVDHYEVVDCPMVVDEVHADSLSE